MSTQFRMSQENSTSRAQSRLSRSDQPQGMFTHRSRSQHSMNVAHLTCHFTVDYELEPASHPHTAHCHPHLPTPTSGASSSLSRLVYTPVNKGLPCCDTGLGERGWVVPTRCVHAHRHKQVSEYERGCGLPTRGAGKE